MLHSSWLSSIPVTRNREKKDKSKFERNLNIILEILKQDPENCDYLGYLGDTYSSGGKNEEARDAYKKAVAAMPENWGYMISEVLIPIQTC